MTNIKTQNSNKSIKSKSEKPFALICHFTIHLLFVIWILSFGLSGLAVEPNKVIKVEAEMAGRYAEVTVHTSQKVKPDIITLESPNRIALVFNNSRIDAPVTIPGPSSFIRMIQAAQFDENTVYVIVEPNENLSYDFTSILGRNKVILELSKANPGAVNRVVAASAPVTPEAVKVATPEEVSARVQPVSTAETVETTQEVVVVTEEVVVPEKEKAPSPEIETMPPSPVVSTMPPSPTKKLPLKGKVIVVDPGHGGRDPGYVGSSGIFEKKLNLAIALKLRKMLNAAGAKVVMTRVTDISVKNRDVVAMANASGAHLFVAIHLNSFISPKIGGCETYYFTPQSRRFANVMERYLSRTIHIKGRGVKKVTYYAVHHTLMPAVLVEPVYLTNPLEERLVMRPQYQQAIATGIFKGITEYVKMNPKWQRSHK